MDAELRITEKPKVRLQSYAVLFVSSKASKENSEGVYIRYMTEQGDEADEAGREEDK